MRFLCSVAFKSSSSSNDRGFGALFKFLKGLTPAWVKAYVRDLSYPVTSPRREYRNKRQKTVQTIKANNEKTIVTIKGLQNKNKRL